MFSTSISWESQELSPTHNDIGSYLVFTPQKLGNLLVYFLTLETKLVEYLSNNCINLNCSPNDKIK